MGRIHPTVDDAVSFHDGTAAPAVRDSVAAHVKSGCASCAAAGVRIRMTLASLRADALTEVPATTVRAAHDQLRAARRTATVREVLERAGAVATRFAHLLLDTATRPALAGARGAVAPVRQLVYEWEEDRYTLRIRRGAVRAAYEVMGQILAADGHVQNVSVRLCPEGGEGVESVSSATGEFLFDAVRPGRYSVVVATADGEVTLPGVELP